MTWRDDLQDASFRGVPFEVDNADGDFGRRVVIHEYPQQDEIETEDLGRMARRFALDGYVIGANYFGARDALMAALDQPGSGELVHPYYGRVEVVVIGYRTSESTREGGMCRFSLQFVVAQPVTKPAATADSRSAVAADVATANAATGEQFKDLVSIVTDVQIAAAQSALTDLLAPLGVLADDIAAIADDPLAIVNQVQRSVSGLYASATDLALSVNTITSLPDRARAAAQSFRALASLRLVWQRVLGQTEGTSTITTNRRATEQLVQTAAVIGAVDLAAAIPYTSYEEAIRTRDEVLAQVERVAADAGDETFAALQGLRATLTQTLRSRGADLARLTTHTPAETLPAIVIAHQLYGVPRLAEYEQDLIDRNRIPHGGFVPGGLALEVLSP